MSDPLPEALKIPEVSKFIKRAAQLRTVKPAIAYWCEYRAVNQIVGKSLHTTDDESFNFTKTLIERLEATKVERADDDAIVDNTTGQAYVEQFAQETFDRAERPLRANRVTRVTADTFEAAATFFELMYEWGEPEPETVQKIKFAKWNAARIRKAILDGKDPNESNPPMPQPEADPAVTDADLDELISPPPPQAAFVQDVPDAGEPSHPPPPPQAQEDYFPTASDQTQPEPFVPSPISQSPGPSASTSAMPPPPITPNTGFDARQPPSPGIQVPPQPSPQIPTKLPHQFAPPPPAPTDLDPSVPPSWANQAPNVVHAPSPQHAPIPPPQAPPSFPPPGVAAPPTYNPPVSQPPFQPSAPPVAALQPAGNFTRDQNDINQAQKHAKFAISALNFDDVPTAVKELQTALARLGAR